MKDQFDTLVLYYTQNYVLDDSSSRWIYVPQAVIFSHMNLAP
jgi:hypothetical protein